jgi:transporter family protein
MGWLAYAGLSALFAGVVPIFGKLGVSGMDSTLATTLRAGIMFGALLIFSLLRGGAGGATTVGPRTGLFIALSGLAGAASWLCYFRALQLGDALRVAPIDRLSSAVTLVLAASLLGERASLGTWAGTGLMIIGAVVVARS